MVKKADARFAARAVSTQQGPSRTALRPLRKSAARMIVKSLSTGKGKGIRVLGVDPGTLRLGYGVIEVFSVNDIRYVECGVLTAPASKNRSERLGIIGGHLRELVEELRPEAFAIEEAFLLRNPQSALALGEARGVAFLVAGDAGLSVTGYPPASVKQAVAGNGQADKNQIANVVKMVLGLKRKPSADAADALAIAICHGRGAVLRGARAPVMTKGRLRRT